MEKEFVIAKLNAPQAMFPDLSRVKCSVGGKGICNCNRTLCFNKDGIPRPFESPRSVNIPWPRHGVALDLPLIIDYLPLMKYSVPDCGIPEDLSYLKMGNLKADKTSIVRSVIVKTSDLMNGSGIPDNESISVFNRIEY